ncbi:DEAD/DEAH box helicase [Taibaiella koreensis]|uniref:DEAD/DEAH box helicase n=1 Tax=Taibaiella koreensis TaxID=1268548 RepID=UPI001F09AF44|nr:DEAD/DEAH box helicase [Taibaiella koreensis]
MYHNATDEVIRRGKRIFHTSGVQMLENDTLIEQVVFRVRNDVYSNYYKVIVQNYLQPKNISLRCQCPYNMGSVCRHEAAALFQLNDLLQSGYFENVKLQYDQKHTTIRMRQITTHFLKLFSSAALFETAETIVSAKRIKVLEAKNDAVKAEVNHEGTLFPVLIRQNEERYFDTSCSCDEKEHPLCVHKAAVFLDILNRHGGHYFATLRNWDTQKDKLLNLYGYSLQDDISGKFEFSYHDGKPFLRVLDPSIKKLSMQPAAPVSKYKEEKEVVVAEEVQPQKRRMGVLIGGSKSEYFPYTGFDLLTGEPDENNEGFSGTIEKLEANQYISPAGLQERDKLLVTALRKQSAEELFKSVKRDTPFGEFWDSLPKELKDVPKDELRRQVWDFYLPRYQRLLEHFSSYPFVYYLPEGKYFVTAHLEKAAFSPRVFQTEIFVTPEAEDVVLVLRLQIDDEVYNYDDITVLNSALIRIGNTFHAAANIDVVTIMEQFSNGGRMHVTAADWPEYLEKDLLPLSGNTAIVFDEGLKENVTEVEPALKLYLRETDKMMVFKPIFDYEGVEKQWLDYTPAVTARNGKVVVHERNEAAEQTFLTLLRHLHPLMQESRKAHSFLLPANEALKGNWYFSFVDKLAEANVQIVGYESLKQLRINPNKPRTQLQISSGIDWFDADVDLKFGEESVSIAEVKKALGKKQNFVTLNDGSIGLLSEDWMEKYALMVKLGAVNGSNKLRLKKFHFSAIEGLSDQISETEVLEELAEKRERLLDYDFEKKAVIPVPDNVTAVLRPYQQAGFQWMSFLSEIGWGGILADDMGLGKTLQTLTFLQHYLNQNPKAQYLVACPTTLIYNWENEIRKFTPEITYLIHHGAQRRSRAEEFDGINLIITTYGTLRSDIKMLSQMNFDYVVLDESQAIKNPMSQVAKASLLLQSKNRLALSGTPVQNNTFDLFAQMNFLNPGMLGSMEFFRNEFATPIDKLQEEEAKAHLRKLIHPFLLRRTKEQVAPDLPEKTEMVLFCEMGQKQRKIYDAYRNSFRSKILGEIEEKGMERSQLSILTGLMKLRQICDSPAILNEDERFENHSVKIEELVRELTENTGNHKALVFSQFLGMLGLIKEELEKQSIPYVYFDGGTSSTEREKAIQRFQQDEECRVFLISLKAGGVGLNLTAADYVYIVDPWWNPAVEQQAIDRTHRIGQTKNIFAYRLICKDTIEEKIMLLQERKLSLVKELIADDNAFMKKLTREDVAYLLS